MNETLLRSENIEIVVLHHFGNDRIALSPTVSFGRIGAVGVSEIIGGNGDRGRLITVATKPVKTELSAPTAFVNDTVVKDTASKDKPAEPVRLPKVQYFIQTSKYVGTKKVTPGIDEVGVTFL